MTYPRMAVSCVVRRGGRYLLVQRGGNAANAGDFAFPGGKVEIGERLAEAALRELREETGLTGRNARFYRLYDLISTDPDGKTDSHYVLAVHLAEVDDHEEAVAADDAVALGWFAESEIGGLQVPPSVLECIESLSSEQSTMAFDRQTSASTKSEHA